MAKNTFVNTTANKRATHGVGVDTVVNKSKIVKKVATTKTKVSNTYKGGDMGYLPSSLITCYIINKITNEKVVFTIPPEELSESYSTSWESTDIRGRSAPYIGYSSNDAKHVQYSITLHDDFCNDLKGTVKKLKALTYPKYKGSIVIPPLCKVKFGGMVDMVAVVNSVDVSWSGPILSGSDHFAQAEVSLDFTRVVTGKIPNADSFN